VIKLMRRVRESGGTQPAKIGGYPQAAACRSRECATRADHRQAGDHAGQASGSLAGAGAFSRGR
jgi:hypothetical protein